MAERRMFAKSIVLSDAFLDMPLSARCLYFTLGMLADDDGFVGSPKGIMRQCGVSQDDMIVLLQKRFVLSFESGVIVIKHWRMNNYLQNDRHKKTTYVEELETLEIDNKGAYTEKKEPMYTDCIQNVYTGKDSIGKYSIEKNNKEVADAPVSSKKPQKEYTGDNLLDEAIKDFIGHRKALRKPMTEKAIDLFINKLDKMADTTAEKIDLINNAIEHGWLTVYPIKEDNKNNAPKLFGQPPSMRKASEEARKDLEDIEAMYLEEVVRNG